MVYTIECLGQIAEHTHCALLRSMVCETSTINRDIAVDVLQPFLKPNSSGTIIYLPQKN